MPYHADSTTLKIFMKYHLHVPDDIAEVICSICRQRCGSRHVFVQISGHPECQCVFGRTCISQWLRSASASSNTCPSCKGVFYNPQREDDGSQLDSDSEDGDGDSDSYSGSYPPRSRGRTQGRQPQHERNYRENAPSPSSTRSSSSSSDNTIPSHQPRRGRQGAEQAHQSRNPNLRSRRQPSPSPSTSTVSSRTLSIAPPSSPVSTSRTEEGDTTAIENFVDDLWVGTWDLVTESWHLTPPDQPRSWSITRAQLVMLILGVYPFEGELGDGVGGADAMLLERLVIRARKMVNKHRKNGVFDEDAELRTEREDVRLAVGFRV